MNASILHARKAVAVTRSRNAVGACSCDVIKVPGQAQAYNEQGFRYFLEVERKRSRLSNRPSFLVLVDLTSASGASAPVSAAAADNVLARLSTSLRETDFVGWYREGVLGAVLTQRHETPAAEIRRGITVRIRKLIEQAVPPSLADRLHLRIFQLPGTAEDRWK
jgi:hypothetical protein